LAPLGLRDPDERFHWFLYLIILAQFIVIAGLLGAFSGEYLSNAYMQTWVRQNAPGLELLLNGNVDVLLIGASVGLTFVLIQNRREASRTISSSQTPILQVTDQARTPTVLKRTPGEDPAQDQSGVEGPRKKRTKIERDTRKTL
jgi:hypothetical protein